MKFPRITLAALLTASMVFAFTPNLLARGNNDTKDILEEIYDKSNDGDADDIFEILSKAVKKAIGKDLNSKEGKKLAKKIIKELKKNKDKLAKGVDDVDLDKVLKKAKKAADEKAKENRGNVNQDESSKTNG